MKSILKVHFFLFSPSLIQIAFYEVSFILLISKQDDRTIMIIVNNCKVNIFLLVFATIGYIFLYRLMSAYFRHSIQTSLSACSYAYFYIVDIHIYICICKYRYNLSIYIVYSERNVSKYLITIVNFHVSKSIID